MESSEPPVESGSMVEHDSPHVPQYESRLSVPFYFRVPVATAGAFVIGTTLGISHGGKTAGMRFRAENAHRFPTTPTGWYLYHKSKNYHSMLGGVKEGFKMGSKVGLWAGAFFIAEEAVDRWRGKKDFLSTVIAGMTIAAGFSSQPRNILPLNTAANTIRKGLFGSLAFGLAQDALGFARGRRLGYVDSLLGRSQHALENQGAEG